MAEGFKVTETIARSPAEVWVYLTDFGNAGDWMPGIDGMERAAEGPLAVGTRLRFTARGKTRETQVTALDPGKEIALTSTQGGVTATYTYTLAPAGDGTEIALDAVCRATGLWKLLHPMIVYAMKKSDSPQLTNLKAAIERRG